MRGKKVKLDFFQNIAVRVQGDNEAEEHALLTRAVNRI